MKGCRRFFGFTLLSVVAAVLLVTMFSVTMYKYSKEVKEGTRASELINAIRTVKTASMKHFTPNMRKNYLYQKLKAEKAVPHDWMPNDPAGRWDTPLWGNLFVGPLVGGYAAYSPTAIGAGDALLITISRVDKDICLRVIQGIEPDVDFIALDNSNRRILKNYDVPFSHANVSTECENSGDRFWLGLMVY